MVRLAAADGEVFAEEAVGAAAIVRAAVVKKPDAMAVSLARLAVLDVVIRTRSSCAGEVLVPVRGTR
ncbi:hypothetical protein ACFQ51_48455 [Streptomyces kaempferi]